MIGIIAAMEVELQSLRSLMQNPEEETISGLRFVRGTLEGRDVVTVVCGIGKVFAALTTQTMILRYAPEAIICTGVAGTLTQQLSIGDIAVSACVVQHDIDTSALGDPPGLISGLNLIELPAHAPLADRLTACANELGLRTLRGVIASGDQFIASAERKAEIVRQFGAIACEMEGGAVAQVCHVNGTPFCVLRAISDSADGSSHMDYPQFVRLAAEQSVRLVRAYLKSL